MRAPEEKRIRHFFHQDGRKAGWDKARKKFKVKTMETQGVAPKVLYS